MARLELTPKWNLGQEAAATCSVAAVTQVPVHKIVMAQRASTRVEGVGRSRSLHIILSINSKLRPIRQGMLSGSERRSPQAAESPFQVSPAARMPKPRRAFPVAA